jgi:putative hemolysin
MLSSIGIICILLALSAFFSAAETAYFSLRESEVVHLKEKGIKYADIVFRLRSQPERLLSTILIGNNIANTVAASYTTFVTSHLFGSYGIGIVTGVLTVAILVFGEIVPKSFALAHNRRIALLVAHPLLWLSFVLYPATVCTQWLGKKVQRASRAKTEHGVTEEELRYMMKMGLKGGFIEKGEHELIERVFSFNDIVVEQIMTPLDQVTMFRTSMKMDDLFAIAVADGYARYPVLDDQDKIIGYITDYDIIRAEHEEKQQSLVSEFISPITSVPADALIDDVCRSMKKSGVHIHLVYSGTKDKKVIGIVTLEDIIEELLGEIVDEEDKKDALTKKKSVR